MTRPVNTIMITQYTSKVNCKTCALSPENQITNGAATDDITSVRYKQTDAIR